MALRTTTLGAFPKPDYVPVTDWFQVGHDAGDYNDRVLRGWHAPEGEDLALLDRATAEVVADQIACGIDLPTDGEMRRENYVHYQCRHMDGFDFVKLTEKVLRNGAYRAELPSITGKVAAGAERVLVRDWQVAEAAAGRPVKMTLPGPMTISDTTADIFYNDPERLAEDIAAALNVEVRALADAGCRYIQIDEPIFARKPEEALAYGIKTLGRCFEGVPAGVTRVMHMCCGYPNRLDDEDYPKADQDAYRRIAERLDGVVDQISIEDAHRHNPLELFEIFEKSTLLVGFFRVASSTLETEDQIARRMEEVLTRLPPERLVAAPDCGLGFLGRDLAMAKLKAMCGAAARF